MTPLDWKSLSRSRPALVALGNFDGVHLGHRRILEALRAEADRLKLDPVALTFEPHPRAFFFPDKRTVLLTSAREKEELIAALGISVVTLVFDSGLAGLEAGDFIREILIRRLQGRRFFLGPDHRFGKGAVGNAEWLRKTFGSDSIHEIAPVEQHGETVSSSAIRHHLKAGRVEEAGAMLGRFYSLRGEVVRGEGRGRQLGFPTANLRLEEERKALPAFGVYGGEARIGDDRFPAVGNIGLRPTFAGEKIPSVEIHLRGIDEDLYGKELGFELRRFIRPEKAFDSGESLRRQIAEDVAAWRP